MAPGGGWLRAGRVGRPHGLDGSFYVTEPKPQLLEAGRPIVVRGVEASIAQRKGSDRRPIIRLEDPANRQGAEALRGEQLLVARENAPRLAGDEWWEEDLEGCTVISRGRPVGTVRRVIALASCEALEVARSEGGADLLVPLVSDAVPSVSIERREIQVDLEFLGEEEI